MSLFTLLLALRYEVLIRVYTFKYVYGLMVALVEHSDKKFDLYATLLLRTASSYHRGHTNAYLKWKRNWYYNYVMRMAGYAGYRRIVFLNRKGERVPSRVTFTR